MGKTNIIEARVTKFVSALAIFCLTVIGSFSFTGAKAEEITPTDAEKAYTSVTFRKHWDGVPDGSNPEAVIHLLANDEVLLSETIHADEMDEGETFKTLVWEDLPYYDNNGKKIEYTIAEEGDPAYVPVASESRINVVENSTTIQTNKSTDWALTKPTFIVTRQTQDGPFLAWTLSHVEPEERLQLLLDTIEISDGKQPFNSLGKELSGLTELPDNVHWFEGPNATISGVKGDIYIDADFTPDYKIGAYDLNYSDQSVWTHFAFGYHRSQLFEMTNKYEPEPGISLTKVADKTSGLEVGDTVTYTFEATNTGNVTLDNVTLDEVESDWGGSGQLSEIECDRPMPTSLKPAPRIVKWVGAEGANKKTPEIMINGEAETLTCTAEYVLQDEDVKDVTGSINNTAIVEGTDPSGDIVTDSSSEEIETPEKRKIPSISVTKTADKTENIKVGDTVTYTIVATNNGETVLNNVQIDDTEFTGKGELGELSCEQPVTLGINETHSCTVEYVVTEGDINQNGNGPEFIENKAVATGESPKDEPVTDTDIEKVRTPVKETPVVPVEEETPVVPVEKETPVVPVEKETPVVKAVPSIEVVKTASKTVGVKAGDVVEYTIVATNNGETVLNNVRVDDTEFTGKGDLSALTCDKPSPVTLAPNESLNCKVSYTVLKSDVFAASDILNTAVAYGETPDAGKVTDSDKETVTPAAPEKRPTPPSSGVNDGGINPVYLVTLGSFAGVSLVGFFADKVKVPARVGRL